MCDPPSVPTTHEGLRDEQLIIKRHTNKAYCTAAADADLIPQFLSPQPARDAMPLQQQQQHL